MKTKNFLFLGGLLLLFGAILCGCGQVGDLEKVNGSKATEGPTIFVDADYTGDASNGTQVFPYKSIQRAIDAAKPGQTVFVKSKSNPSAFFTEPLYINKNINLAGDGSTKIEVDLNPADADIYRGMIIFDGPSAIGSISGFEISHANYNNGSGIICKNGASPHISSNKLFYHKYAIFITDGSSPIIDNNTIEGNGYGVRVLSSNGKVTKIYNNKICKSRDFTLIGAWSAVMLIDGAQADIYNNLIYQNLSGVTIRMDNVQANIVNNLFVDNYSGTYPCAIYIEGKYSTANVFNNIFDNNTYGVVNAEVGGANCVNLHYNSFTRTSSGFNYDGNHINIIGFQTIQPIFTDTENYTLTDGSAAAYTDLGHPNTQYNDKNGSRNDLGAQGGSRAI